MRRVGSISKTCVLMALPLTVHAALFGFNAEDGASATATVSATFGSAFSTSSDASALGGQYIDWLNGGGTAPGSADRVTSYDIMFPEAGTYDLYVRVWVGPTAGQDDSFYYGNGFGVKNPAGNGDTGVGSVNGDWIEVNDILALSGDSAEQYVWINFSDWSGQYTESGVSFNVASPGTQTFQIGAREDGLRIDAFAFGTTGSPFSDAELDAAVDLQPAIILSRSPASGATITTNQFPIDLGAVLVDGSSTVDPNSIALALDGTNLTLSPGDIARVATTTTVQHAVSSLSTGSHSVSLVYEGTSPSTGPLTNTWSFTVEIPVEVHVCVIGDSTVYNSAPRVGWGQVIGDYFDARVEFDDRAIPGRSTKTFMTEGDWAAALNTLGSGDYVLIQFGHNDSHNPIYPEATDAFGDYQTNLQQYIDDTRAKGAIPVLVKPMYRRNYDAEGHLLSYVVDGSGYTNDLLPYATAMQQVAESNAVTCIDLFTASGDLMQGIGEAACENLMYGGSDTSHWIEKGAHAMAALVTRGLQAGNEPLKEYIRERSKAGTRVYVDAAPANTTAWNGSSFGTWTPDGTGSNWTTRTGYGNDGQVYQGQFSADSPRLRTTVSGLEDGSYRVYAYLWAANGPWRMEAALTNPAAPDLALYSEADYPANTNLYVHYQDAGGVDSWGSFASLSAYYSTTLYSNPFGTNLVMLAEGNRRLMEVYLGTVSGTGISVFIDDDSAASDQAQRTWYDGIGYERFGATLDPVIQSIGISGGMVTLQWSSEMPATYRIMHKTNLNDAVWTPVKTGIAGDASITTHSVSVSDADQEFFRIEGE